MYIIYSLSLNKNFTAEHFLPMIEGDENRLHSHDYNLSIRIEGNELDKNGFLIDIVRLNQIVDSMIDGYKGRVLNELESFEGENPTLENFSRILYDDLVSRMKVQAEKEIRRISSIEVFLWESEEANASYQEEVDF
ncbi:MAG: 6-carboxytetrahydropterin synthase [Candidatus Thermoplasmatota archaeon]